MEGVFGAPTIDEVAKMLAGEHIADDPQIEAVFRVPHPSEVRLIEVTPSVHADGEVLPFRFAAGDGVPFKLLVVLLNPDDWERREGLRWPDELDPNHRSLEVIYRRGAAE